MKCDGNREFVGSVSSGLCAVTAQVKRSKTGAGVSLLWGRHWAVPGCALGIAVEHTQQCRVSRLSVLRLSPCPLSPLSCLAECLYWESLPKPENKITSLFPFWASDLHISGCHIELKGVHEVLLPIADTAFFFSKTGSTWDQQEETYFSGWLVWSRVEYCSFIIKRKDSKGACLYLDTLGYKKWNFQEYGFSQCTVLGELVLLSWCW